MAPVPTPKPKTKTTPEEEQIRLATSQARANSTKSLSDAQAQSKQATAAAETNIRAQQAEAAQRLLADAQKRGYAGGADRLASIAAGPAEQRVSSLEEGQGARDRDYAARGSITNDLYGRIDSLAPLLGQQLADARAAAAAAGGGGGGGSGSGAWSAQTDVLNALLDRITQDDSQSTTSNYERLYGNLEGLGPSLAGVGQDLLARNGSNPKTALSALSKADPRALLGNQNWGGHSFLQSMTKDQSQKQALQRAFQDAIRFQEQQRSTTAARTQSTQSDKTNYRIRAKGVAAPARPLLTLKAPTRKAK